MIRSVTEKYSGILHRGSSGFFGNPVSTTRERERERERKKEREIKKEREMERKRDIDRYREIEQCPSHGGGEFCWISFYIELCRVSFPVLPSRLDNTLRVQ